MEQNSRGSTGRAEQSSAGQQGRERARLRTPLQELGHPARLHTPFSWGEDKAGRHRGKVSAALLKHPAGGHGWYTERP